MNLILLVFFIKIISCDFLNSASNCSSQCFCHISSSKFFLAQLLLIQCDDEHPPLSCYQSQFLPLSTYSISNHSSSCHNDEQCLHTLETNRTCQHCQLIYNHSNRMKTCFHFCEHIPLCGFMCIQQAIVLSMVCQTCSNITCRCIHPTSSSCFSPLVETTTPRWMQKRGFPAAAILALIILAAALLVVAMKLIYRQLDLLDRRHSLAHHQSLLLSQTS